MQFFAHANLTAEQWKKEREIKFVKCSLECGTIKKMSNAHLTAGAPNQLGMEPGTDTSMHLPGIYGI